MTTNEAPAAEDAQAEAPVESITTPPPDVPPAVSIGLPAGTVAAGVPATVTLFVDRGTTYRLQPPNTWVPIPMITYSELELTVPGVTQIRDHRSSVNDSSTPFSITFPTPGTYQITGCGRTGNGTEINAPGPRSLTVTAPGPPAFTWSQPADGTVIDLTPTAGQVTVDLSSGTDQLYPWTVAVTCDGVTSSEQHSGTRYLKTINLAKTPLGPRSISVTCTDPRGQATTRTRSIVAHDGAPPTVTLDPFTSPVTVSSLPFQFLLTGKTPGAQSGVTKVEYAVVNGPSGVAENTGPGGDWSTWRAVVNLPTTGTFQFTVTATDSRGGTASASSAITLQFPASKPVPGEPGPDPLPPADPPPTS
ncbi:hypothetical protein ACRYCC_33140 [Actinomadura scrupuli]|uniref:hypothetical protein n=1 Tax=Actinomadura scrupuli TaxID=559629 RepID=UPI003D9554A5